MSQPLVDDLGRVKKTHCKHGHLFPEDSRWSTNWKGYKCRVCNECQCIRMQRKRENPERRQLGAEKARKWRKANPEQNRTNYTSARKTRRDWVDSQRTQCSRCPETRTPCLDFHHRNPNEKEVNVSVAISHWSIERLKIEIAKCDVICANCHRILHHEERNSNHLGG